MEATLDNSCYTQAVHGIMGRQVDYYEKASPSHGYPSPTYQLPCLHSYYTFQYHRLLDAVI